VPGKPERPSPRGDRFRSVVTLGLVLAAGALSSPLAGHTFSGSSTTVSGDVAPHNHVVVAARALPSLVAEPAARLEPVGTPSATRTEPAGLERVGPDAAAGRPTRLVVPRLHVNASVIPIAAPGGVLLPPDDPRTLGWWDGGAVPGAVTGGALITGHTVHTGGGAFDDLETLKPGDPVRVVTDKGGIEYVVSDVTIYPKSQLAAHARRVFSQSVPGRLVLITCEDWNGSTYLSNTVVLAEPV
jgi:LPXTG-site transpeptidase (sortase) family protein